MKIASRLMLAVLAMFGCGAEPVQQCSASLASCGGDAVGTWRFSENSCYHLDGWGSSAGTLAMNGAINLTLDATGSFAATGSGTDYVITLPPAFFAADAGVSDCETLKGYASAIGGSCVGGGGVDCVCTYPSSTLDKTGTWSTSEKSVTFKQPFRTVTEDYCVAGSSLTLGWNIGNFAVITGFTRQ